MTYLDKTFCASPNCKNDCGRKMTDEQYHRLVFLNYERVAYGYFCGKPSEGWLIENDECQKTS